ncbi:MAG: AI-2E family transporter [Candidatus Paceibacterota bacterium]
MTLKSLQHYFLIVLIVVTSTLCFFIFQSYLVVLVLAAVFAVVLQPLHRLVLRVMRGLPGLAAAVTILLTVTCVLVPLTFIAFQVLSEAQQLYTAIAVGEGNIHFSAVIQDANRAVSQYAPGLAVSEADLALSIDQYSQEALSWLVHSLGNVFGSVARLLFDLFIFVIALYYLLRDGIRLKQWVAEATPLSDADDNKIFARLEGAVNSVIRGSLTIAIVQGILTATGFSLFGVPNAILWGVVAALASLIPGIGTALVLAPAVAYLFIVGATLPAVGLLVWGVLAVGMIDNFLGPKLMGKGMRLHPLLVLLSVLGGLAFFGAAGLFIGPLSISLLFALLAASHYVID